MSAGDTNGKNGRLFFDRVAGNDGSTAVGFLVPNMRAAFSSGATTETAAAVALGAAVFAAVYSRS